MTRDNALRLAASRMYLTEGDVLMIQHLVHGLRGRPGTDGFYSSPLRVVDLGAGSGTTALAVLDVAEDAQITTVDIDQANLDWAEAAVRAAYPAADWVGVRADAGEAALRRQTADVDLLLHDAAHESLNVQRDIRAWLPLLAPHARIWIHDAQPPPPAWGQSASPGVMEAIDALVAAALVEGGLAEDGLGWVGKAV